MRTWIEIERTNKVARYLRGMTNRANEVADGAKRVAWLYGPSGVGKTHTMREAMTLLRIQGLKEVECNPRDYKDLLDHFEETEGARPIVLEEADVIWRSERMLNIFKIATDPIREPHERCYRGVMLTAPIFVTTNVQLGDQSDWSPALKRHGPALFRRNAPRGVPEDRAALWEYSVALALFQKLIDYRVIEDGIKPRQRVTRSAQRRADAIQWFSEQRDNLVSISPGSLQTVAEAFDYSDDFDREIELEALLVAERRRKPIRPDRTDWVSVIQDLSSGSPPT